MFLRRFIKKQKGQGLVEYALIIAVVAILIVATLFIFKDAIIGVFNSISDVLKDPSSAVPTAAPG